jgi:hypothetical protein
MRRLLAALLLLSLARPASAATGWREEVVGQLPGAAFSTLADLDGDGRPEVVANSFGTVTGFGPTAGGTVASYRRDGRRWLRTAVVTPADGIQFPNEPTLTDVDGDGRVDLVQPGGFFICGACGSLSWWRQEPGSRWTRHDLVPVGSPLFFHHAEVADLDGDGLRDLVTVGETATSATTMVFLGVSDGFSTTPRVLGEGLGSLPVVTDVDGDGDLDIASAQYFSRNGSFAWLENVAGAFVKHVIAADLGGAIQLSLVPGIGWVGTNHTNTTSGPPGTPASAVFLLTPGADPRLPWSVRPISSGITSRADSGGGQQQGAPGVFGWGDVDGDGDNDLAVSGDGDRHLYLLRQTSPGEFRTEVIADQRGQAGGGKVLGRSVLFSSYDAGLVALYKER